MEIACPENIMVDLSGYVIIIVETKDKKIRLYGSPADRAELEVADEILEVNGTTLEGSSHTQVIAHLYEAIQSRTVCLRVRRRTGNRLALDLAQNSNVQDAFLIAVEQQARERLERLSALKKIKPVDMSKLSQQLNREATSKSESEQANGFIEKTPIYVTAYPPSQTTTSTTTAKPPAPATASSPGGAAPPGATQDLELTQELPAAPPAPSNTAPAPPGRTEVLIGQDVTPTADTRVKTTAIVENHRGLSVSDDIAAR